MLMDKWVQAPGYLTIKHVDKKIMRKAALVTVLNLRITAFTAIGIACLLPALHGQGIVLNEVSNGPSGTKEYTEMVVAGVPCTTVDLRGWIVDDNNGDFACGPVTGVGIAQGHIRFGMVANWAAVPVGSIILIYNDADLNALVPVADPTDADMDSVYIVPISSALLDRTSGGVACPPVAGSQIPMGCNATCPATGSAAYIPSTYAAGGSVTQISMANTGDAMQIRTPAGTYFHGISYGAAAVTGGPEGLKISGVGGGGHNYYLSAAPHNVLANWAMGVDDGIAGGDETPGAPNNAINDSYIDLLLGDCILPVVYSSPLAAALHEQQVELTWATTSEENNNGFEVLRFTETDPDFTVIGKVTATDGKMMPAHYSFTDEKPLAGRMLYRLRQLDVDGTAHYSSTAEVVNGIDTRMGVQVYPNPTSGLVYFHCQAWGNLTLRIMNVMGDVVSEKQIHEAQGELLIDADLSGCSDGLYYYSLSGNGASGSGIISVEGVLKNP